MNSKLNGLVCNHFKLLYLPNDVVKTFLHNRTDTFLRTLTRQTKNCVMLKQQKVSD
jgi:hypothetical protein